MLWRLDLGFQRLLVLMIGKFLRGFIDKLLSGHRSLTKKGGLVLIWYWLYSILRYGRLLMRKLSWLILLGLRRYWCLVCLFCLRRRVLLLVLRNM
jgi:uncharacterized membrane protein